MSADPVTAANLFAAGHITLDVAVAAHDAPSRALVAWSIVPAVGCAVCAAGLVVGSPTRYDLISAVLAALVAVLYARDAVREWRAYVARRSAHLAAVAAVEAARRNLNAPEPR